MFIVLRSESVTINDLQASSASFPSLPHQPPLGNAKGTWSAPAPHSTRKGFGKAKAFVTKSWRADPIHDLETVGLHECMAAMALAGCRHLPTVTC